MVPNKTDDNNRRLPLVIALALLFVLGLSLGHRQLISPDLGFHLCSARWILENGKIPSTDIFTYTVPDNTYIDLQWTYQLVTYGLNKVFGPAGISALTTFMTLAFTAILLLRTKRRLGRIPLVSLWMVVIFFMGNLWEVRPHLFSWCYGALIFLVLEENSRGNRKPLPFLPVLMLLWVNAHSLYVLGFISIATYVFADVVTGFIKHGKFHFDKWLMIWSVAALLICFINPYHIGGLKFPVSQFLLIQGGQGYKSALSGTAEFLSPFRFQEYIVDGKLVIFQPIFFWQLFSLLAIVSMIAARKKIKFAEWIIFAGFLFIFNQASKNFGYFIMACFPAVADGLEITFAKIADRFNKKKSKFKTLLPHAAVYAVCIGLTIAAATNWLYYFSWQLADFGTGFSKKGLPVDACDFITDNDIHGRIINCWDDGGYIGWATNSKVFINSEGNTIGLDFYDKYIKIRGPEGFAAALKQYQPTIAIVRFRVTPYWLYYLQNVADDWRMVFADNLTAVFLHSSVSPQISALPPARPGVDYIEYSPELALQIIHNASQSKHPSFTQNLQGSAAYPINQMQRSSFYLHTNQVDACIGTCLEGLQKSCFTVPDLMLNLGHAYNAKKQYTLADVCYDAFLSVDDEPVIAQEIANQRKHRRR